MTELVAVRLSNGLVVWHTWEEWTALVKGVDLEAAEAMTADVDTCTEGDDDE